MITGEKRVVIDHGGVRGQGASGVEILDAYGGEVGVRGDAPATSWGRGGTTYELAWPDVTVRTESRGTVRTDETHWYLSSSSTSSRTACRSRTDPGNGRRRGICSDDARRRRLAAMMDTRISDEDARRQAMVDEFIAIGIEEGVFHVMARDGQLLELACEVPKCYCEQGRDFFPEAADP